jgi:hypothetical protein
MRFQKMLFGKMGAPVKGNDSFDRRYQHQRGKTNGVYAMRRKRIKEPGTEYVKATDTLEEIEKKLFRVFNQWIKAKARLRHVNRKLDEIQLVNFNTN